MKVLLADDHKMMREGLRGALESAGIEVIGEAADGLEVIAEAQRSTPDVVVMDVGMPKLNGIDATRRLTHEMPGVKVIGLSMNADRRYVMAMLQAGAKGYLLKSGAMAELVAAIGAVGAGKTYLSPEIAGEVVEVAVQGGPPPNGTHGKPLSMREREVLQLLAEGKSSKEIAKTLGLGVPTVETHRRQLMAKLELRTVAELTKYAIREGLTSADG